MTPATPEQRRKITQFMQTRRRQLQAHEPRRYPKTATTAAAYIDDFNRLNRDAYRARITLNY